VGLAAQNNALATGLQLAVDMEFLVAS